jgi:hypothetical protein
MIDMPGLLFIGAACFVLGVAFEDLLWDLRSVAEPYTEDTSNAITAFYVNATIGTRQRAPYLLALAPLALLVIVCALIYKCVHGLDIGDRHAIITSALSIVLIFPQIVLTAASTLPTIRGLITRGKTLPLETRRRMHRRIFFQHATYFLLTVVAIVAHVAM